ncbi:MAG: metal-dependent hydrolase family protein, partial [Gemmatimonadaceae bacterium]
MQLRALAVTVAMSLAGSAGAQATPPGPAATTAIRAARMITIASPAIVSDAVIVVSGDRIVAAGPSAGISIPAGATVIDLGDVTLLPGFIDSHVHIAGRTLGDPLRDNASVRDFESYGAILGVANA